MPRALLLSPDDQAVSAITGVLEEMSVTCERPLDGLSAAQKLNSNSFDLVLVDCENLPAAKLIFDVCRRGKNGHYPVPIAIVDGRAGLPTAFRLGAELILTKPVAKDQARSTIRTAVGRVRKEIPAAESVPAMTMTKTASAVMPSPVVPEERAPIAAAAAVSSQTPSFARPLSSTVSAAVPAAAASATSSAPGVTTNVTTKMHSAVGEIAATPTTQKLDPPSASFSAAALLDLPESPSEPSLDQAASSPSKPAHPVKPSADLALAELESMELEESQLKSSTLDKTPPDRPADETVAPVFSAYRHGQRKKRSPLVALLMLVLAGGGFYAAWMYEPGFRAIVQPQIDRVLVFAGMAVQPQSMPPAPAPSSAKPSAQIAPTPISAPVPQPPASPNETPSAVPDSATVPAATPADAASSDTPLPGENGAIILSSQGAQKRLAYSVPPTYPVEARLGEAEGTVVLRAVVDENGKVEGLRLIEGNAALASAAIQAVKQWRYRPYVRDGKVLPFQTVVIVDFQRP